MIEKRRQTTLRIGTLREQGQEQDLRSATPAERLGMVWPLTLEAWGFAGDECAESRLSRHIVAVRRGTR